MNTLRQNISNIYGEKGIDWINNLPDIVKVLANHWGLNKITPVSNMSFNYVAKAIQNTSKPVVLKIGIDREGLCNEKQAITNLGSQGIVKLIDYNNDYNSLLLEQAVPGITLTSIYRTQPIYVMDSYIQTNNAFRIDSEPFLPMLQNIVMM